MPEDALNVTWLPRVGAVYQHFKGPLYRVEYVGRFSSSSFAPQLDGTVVVIYSRVLDGAGPHVRPAVEWNDVVGEDKRPRFRLLE